MELYGRQMSEMAFNELRQEEVVFDQFEIVPALIRANEKWTCQRCNNQQSFAQLPNNKQVYCTNCLSLGRFSSHDKLVRFKPKGNQPNSPSHLTWQGRLSRQQAQASEFLVEGYKDKSVAHLVQAVTGAGKTEMIFQVIDHCLMQGGRIALVSPRIDVCLELTPRIQEAFKQVSLLTMYGAMEEDYRYTDIVISTVHQLWKFYQAFDLIIVDEIDAFPLSGDPHLHFAINNAKKTNGKVIYLTATPDAFIQEQLKSGRIKQMILPARFHRKPLVRPTFIWVDDWRQQIEKKKERQLYKLIKKLIARPGVKLIFMPDIQLAEKLFTWLKSSFKEVTLDVVHARDPQRKEKVEKVRQGIIQVLITTTILRRVN